MAVTAQTPVRLFQSYAHEDYRWAESLLQKLHAHFGGCQTADCLIWTDNRIAIGQYWDEAIKHELMRCSAGLLLLSPSALASNFVRNADILTRFPEDYFDGTFAKARG